MRGHKGQVRSVSVEPEFGELLVSGGADSTVRIWALPYGNCLSIYNMNAPVTCVQFCPNPKKALVLVFFTFFFIPMSFFLRIFSF